MTKPTKDWAGLARGITGDCTCTQDYAERGLTAPDCCYCKCGPIITQALRDAVAAERERINVAITRAMNGYKVDDPIWYTVDHVAKILEVSEAVEVERERYIDEKLLLRAVADAAYDFERNLSEFCDGAERENLREAFKAIGYIDD